jgi:TatD DNase family protein
MNLMLIDTHCHLNFAAFEEDWRETAGAAVKAGVTKMIVVGTDLTSSQKAVELAANHPALYAAVGFHPHHAKSLTVSQLRSVTNRLKELAQNKKVVAIGECGLDYYVYQKTKYPETAVTEKIKVLQKKLFGQQIQLAKELNLPLIVHNRSAGNDTLDALDHFCKPASPAGRSDGQMPAGVFHCISGSKKLLQKILDLGFYVGIDGNVTYSQEVQLLASAAPLEKMLLETDAPYLTPEPDRSLRNTPTSVKIVAAFLADLKEEPFETVANVTTKNAKKLFNL